MDRADVTRTIISLFVGLAVAVSANLAIILAVNWPDVVWPPAWIYGLLARLFVAGGAGGFCAGALAPRGRVWHAAPASLPGLVTSFDWWRTRDPIWLVASIALCGIVGALTGGWLVTRLRRRGDHSATSATKAAT